MDPRQVQQPTQYHQLQDGPREKTEHFLHQQQPDQPYQPYHGDAGSLAAPSSGTILSVKRSIALGVIAVLGFLLLAVIGLSAGLGVSQRGLHQAQSDLDMAQAALSSAIAAGYALVQKDPSALTDKT